MGFSCLLLMEKISNKKTQNPDREKISNQASPGPVQAWCRPDAGPVSVPVSVPVRPGECPGEFSG